MASTKCTVANTIKNITLPNITLEQDESGEWLQLVLSVERFGHIGDELVQRVLCQIALRDELEFKEGDVLSVVISETKKRIEYSFSEGFWTRKDS